MNIQNSLKFLLPLVLGSFLNLNAQQSVLSSFNGYADIVNVVQDPDATGADSVFTLQINNFAGSPRFQPFGPWIAADVQVGCVVWVDCSRLVIKEVIYASYSSMEVKVTVPQPDWLLGVSVPLINTRCAVVYEDQYLLTALPAPADGNAGALSGINNSLFACMLNHYSQALLTTKNSVNEITDYVAGLDTVPSESPIPNLGETWRNSVGQLFYSDGTQWLTDKEVLFTNYGLEGLPSNLYKLGLDTLGQDTLYVSNNGIFNRFQAGLVYKEGFGINIYATDSIEVDTNQIATQYDLSQIEVKIDTFRVNSPNLELSLKNDNEPVKTVPLSSIVTGGGGITGNGVVNYLSQYNSTSTLDTTGIIWVGGRMGIGTATPTRQLTTTKDIQVNGRRIGLGTGDNTFNTFLSAGVGTNFTGNHTVAVGSMDLLNITTASGNVLIGSGAGNNITTGGSNTYIGRDAGLANQTATVNFGLGTFALLNHTTGNNNIAIGFDAGRRISTDVNMTSSETGIYIGNNTKPLANGNNNQIIIGHSALGLGSNTTAIGTTSTTQTWLGGSLTLGTQISPLARLHVSGSSALGTDRAVLVTNNATTPLNLFEVRNAGEIYFNQYPNTLNTSGNPVNVLSTGTDGVLQSHPISEVISAAGAITSITGGTGISVSTVSGASTITNTAPDQTVSITGAGINTVSGTYPNFTITGTEVDGSTTNELQTLSTGTNTLTLSNGGGTVTVDTDPASDVTGSGTSGQVSYWNGTQTQTGSSSLLYNDTQKSLTLTNSTQSGIPRGWLMQQTTGDGAGNLFIMQKSRAGAITSGTTIGVWDAEGFDGSDYQKSSRITFTSSGTIGAGAVPGTISFVTANSSGTLTTRTTLDHLGVFNHLGSAAIGASFAPAANLHVRGSGTSSSTWTAQFHNSAGNNNALMIRDDGRVGIGTSTLSNILTIAGSAAIPRIYIEAPDNTESATILFDAKRPAGNPIFSFTNQGRFIIGNGIGFYATSGGPSAPILRSGSGIFVGDAGAFDNTSANGMVVLGKPNNFARITTGVGSTASTVELIGTHSPTSTNIRYNMLSIIPVYNQTGTADGAFVGIDYNPTIASLLGRHYAATFRSGSVGIGTSAPTDQLHTTSTVRLEGYPNTLNSTGSPVNVLSTSSTGVVESHPVSEIVTSGGGLTGNGVAGYLPQYNTASTLDTSGVFWNATTGRLGIGTSSPSATLSVSGRINQINIGNSVFLGIGAGQNDDLSDNYNTFIGRDAGFTNTTGAFNTFIGYNAGKANTTASSNVMIGASAGEKNTATNNLFVGAAAGANNTTGINNTFLGRNTGFNNITGSYNLFIGSGSGYGNTNSYNVFIGVDAGYFNSSGRLNLFTGYRAGYSNTTGEYNFFLGSDAGSNNKTGSSNVLIGVDAGRYVGLTGTTIDTLINNSILIGQDARNLGTNQTNQIVIGRGGRGLGSNTTVLGNSTTTQTWLGGSLTLGTQITPLARLHVAGASALNTDRAVLVTDNAVTPVNLFEVRNGGDVYLNKYPNTRNDTGTPSNILSTDASGLVLSNPISEVITSGGGILGSGSTNRLAIWNSSTNLGFESTFIVDSTNSELGLGISPSATFDVLGNVEFQNPTTAYDGGVIGSELLTTGTGTGWTGTSFATGYTHVVGNTADLVSAFSPTSGNIYQILYTVTGRTSGSFTFSFGGYTSGTINTNVTDVNVSQIATTTGVLTITPTTDFNGTIIFFIKRITGGSAVFTGRNAAGTIVYEERYSPSVTNLFQGIGAGQFNTTGTSNMFQGNYAGRVNTTGSVNFFQGYYAGYSNTVGNYNTFQGAAAGYSNTTGSYNFFQGLNAGYSNTTGNFNMFQGYQPGYLNTTGYGNIFQGYRAGYSNTQGFYNIFQGYQAGYANTSGNYNIFQGGSAGTANTTGSYNIFQGFASGVTNTVGTENLFSGTNSGRLNIAGSYNIYYGGNSGYNNARGNNNILLGYNSGRYIGTTGTVADTSINNSIIIGYDARSNVTSQTNQIIIGYNGRGLGSNTTRIGNTSTIQTHLDGELTIGNTFYDNRVAARIVGANVLSTEYSLVVTNSNGATSTNTNGSLVVTNSGLVGVGTYSPTATLFVKSPGNSVSTNSAFSIENSQATPLNLLTVLENGNVGVGGITSPTYKVDILGGLRLGTSTVQFAFGESGGNSIFLGSITNHPYRFVVNTNEVARFTTSNRFGLLTDTPTRTLDVNGEARIRDLTTDTPTRIVGADADGDLGEISLGSGLSITSGVLNTSSTLNTGSGTAGQVTFWNGTNSITGSSTFTWDNTTGRLGIGLVTSLARLSMTGEGTTSSTESIRINDSGNVNYFTLNDAGSLTIGKNITLSTAQTYRVIGGGGTITNNVSGGLSNDVAFFSGGMTFAGSETFNAASAARFAANNRNTSTSNQINTLYIVAQNETAASRALSLVGSDIFIINNSTAGTISEATGYKVRLSTHAVGSTITNTYGMLIGDLTPTTAGTQTNVYSIYSDDVSARMVHRGSMSVGTTGSSARLHVQGADESTSNWTAQFHNSTGTSNSLMIRNDGNVGIGTSAPAAKLEVDGNAIIGLDRSFTTGNSQYSHLDLTGNFTASTFPNNSVVGAISSQITYSGTTAFGNSRAFNFILSNNNTSTTNNFVAGYFSSRVITAGQGSNIIGLSGDVQSSSTGTITSANAVEANMNKSGTGTITNLYGLRVRDLANTDGTLTNTYGLYIGDITAGTQTNTPYSIYVEDANARNYFAGSVGIGSTTPARTLHVAGEVRITDLSTDNPTKLVGADADGDLDDVVLGEGLTLSSGVLDVNSAAAVLASEVVIESSTATTIDLDVSGNVKTIDGGNATFVYPSNLSRLSVYKNGVRLTRTGSLTTRDFTVNTTTNEITFSTPLVSTDRIVIVKL